MSMTLANAKIYVARILGGQDDTNLIAAAGDAITSAFATWNRRDDGWTFCLKDTTNGFALTNCTLAIDGITVSSTDTAILGVNVGITVASASFGVIPATTLVKTVTRNTVTGAVTAFTLSVAAAPGTGSMAMGGDIPLVAGTNRYSLPVDFDKPYQARLLSNKRVLTYIKYREVGRKVADLDNLGTPTHYTTYNQNGFDAATQHKNLLVFRNPSAADTLRMYYYRSMDPTLDPIDVPMDFIFPVLHLAQFELVRSKNADDSRLSVLGQIAKDELQESMDNDSIESEDEDIRVLSQMEMGLRTNVNLDIWDEIM